MKVPVCCKIRLLDAPAETERLCLQLQEAGCRLIAVHARRRGTATRRRDGPAHLEEIALLQRVKALRVPILSNGDFQLRVFGEYVCLRVFSVGLKRCVLL